MDWFATAFTLWGSATTWLELVAFAIALLMVACNMREIHWGWPLAAISSAMYCALFWRSGLYAEAMLQVFFATLAAWGWLQWLRGGVGAHATVPRIHRMTGHQWWTALLASAALWPAIAWVLIRHTDSTVPWWDSLPTALSVVAQVMLGRKFIENWLLWLVVNLVSIGLFAHKALWLTVGLYALFALLSVAGWRAWSRRMATHKA